MGNVAVLYAACVLGAVALLIALPRAGRNWSLLGGLLGAAALGAAFLAFARSIPPGEEPTVFFYAFAFLAVLAAGRMITHPRPVIAAIYFILVVIATAGLFLLLAAEFMAFALVIVYAGAILVTYLFVIMLAQESPSDAAPEGLAPYDANAREPLAAVLVSFVLLALLLGAFSRAELPSRLAAGEAGQADPALAVVTEKVEAQLIERGIIPAGSELLAVDVESREFAYRPDPGAEPDVLPLPDGLRIDNVERIGTSLLVEFPISLEVAGIILLMAMLGAVVLSRRPAPALVVIEEKSPRLHASERQPEPLADVAGAHTEP